MSFFRIILDPSFTYSSLGKIEYSAGWQLPSYGARKFRVLAAPPALTGPIRMAINWRPIMTRLHLFAVCWINLRQQLMKPKWMSKPKPKQEVKVGGKVESCRWDGSGPETETGTGINQSIAARNAFGHAQLWAKFYLPFICAALIVVRCTMCDVRYTYEYSFAIALFFCLAELINLHLNEKRAAICAHRMSVIKSVRGE